MKKVFRLFIILTFVFIFAACGEAKIKYVDDNQHTYGEWIRPVAATCYDDGAVGHYHCSHCGKDFDNCFNELTSIVDTCSGHNLVHNKEVAATGYSFGSKENYTCSKCGRIFADEQCQTELEDEDLIIEKKILSVSEVMNWADNGQQVMVRAVVIGGAAHADGGITSYILKDENSNQLIVMRGRRADDVSDPSLVASCIKGYSYAINLVLPLGSIIEVPVTHEVASGSCGERNKDYLLWQGDDYDHCYYFGGIKEWREKYVVGTKDDYSIDLTKVTTTVSNQQELTNLLTGYESFQNKVLCLEGTTQNPLRFVTGAKNSDGDLSIDREYLYFFYGEANSLSSIKVGKGYPVLSNFGNTYNIASPLSTVLFGQTEYEDVNFNNIHEFIGKIYCMVVGGNAEFYHFVVLNEDHIQAESTTGNHDLLGVKQCKEAFFDAMETFGRSIGMTLQGDITTAVGIYHIVSCKDLVRVGIAMSRNAKARELWSDQEYIGSWIDPQGATQTRDFPNLVWENSDIQKYLLDVYGSDSLLGGKGGSLAYSDDRKITVATMTLWAKGPNGSTIVVAVSLNIYGDEHEYSTSFKEACKLIDILYKKAEGKDTTLLEREMDCACYAGVVLPAENAPENGYDWWGENSSVINLEHNGDHTIITASCWKMMTCITALQYLETEDFNKPILVLKSDLSSTINSSWPNYKSGEIVTLELALHSMMRRSSNVSPTIIARTVGEMIIRKGLSTAYSIN